MSTKKKQNLAPLIATVVIAGLAFAAAVVAAVMLLGGKNDDDSESTGESTQSQTASVDTSYLTQEYMDEAGLAAHDLLNSGHEILRLFVTEGLAHNDEPYGNLPEDGYYTVNSTDYDTLEKIEELVHSVYTDDAAEQVLTNADGNGLVVYANRKVQQKVETAAAESATGESSTAEDDGSVKYETVEVLGISADFVADESKSWVSCTIKIEYVEEGRCTLEVGLYNERLDTLGTAEASSESEPDRSYTVDMVKTDDGWRLEEFVTG